MKQISKRIDTLCKQIDDENRVDDDFTGGYVPDPEGKWLDELRAIQEEIEELPQPVQSPSEWIVEVGGRKRGIFKEVYESEDHPGLCYVALDERPGCVDQLIEFEDCEYDHIRLLTKDGKVVMDNKME